MSWHNKWDVLIDGTSIMGELGKRLISIKTTDKDGATSDSCSITVDDTGGLLRLPRTGAKIRVLFFGVEVFRGALDAPKSSGNKNGGRLLNLSAKSVANAERAKVAQHEFADDQTLGQFLNTIAKNAGFDISIDDEMAAIKRPYWGNDGESFQAYGEQLAKELGGTFKIKDDKAVLAKRGTGRSPSGALLAGVKAAWGDNLVGWNIEPKQPRPIFGKTQVRYFDRAAGETKTVTQEHDGADTKVARMIKTLAADKPQAEGIAAARGSEQERESGGGSVVVEPMPEAQVEALLTLSGARAGVDGSYRITSVEHSGSKSSGNLTTLNLKEPKGGAGVDER